MEDFQFEHDFEQLGRRTVLLNARRIADAQRKTERILLAQVVGNLLNNACKFTDKGGRIWLTVERQGEQAVIRVRDSGIGIAADQLPRMFDMFAQ